jgi:hypothetical protein
MVKKQKKNNRKSRNSKGFNSNSAGARKINASTHYETCTEQLSPFGGLLALIKFFDLVHFEELFNSTYQKPSRDPKMGHHAMMAGILMLLFIGFNRIWHFFYVRLDAMLCGFFRVNQLPVASTFWRYVNSLGINQAKSLLKLMSSLRERVWKLCGYSYIRQVRVNLDTTVETIYGDQQGGRKGHNTKNRGKKGYRPVLGFIEETREYLCGKLRRGETLSGEEAADIIRDIRTYLPSWVQYVLIRADGEFLSWEAIQAAVDSGFRFIIGNKGCRPVFDPNAWYRPRKREDAEYNTCYYQPGGWGQAMRFVAMRIPKEKKEVSNRPIQCQLFKDDRYVYRIFCTNLAGKAHHVIDEYDKRADVENLIGEAKREGLEAIPSARFKNNYAFFQIVMLAYNIWRYMKIVARQSISREEADASEVEEPGLKGIMANTIRIARLKLLFLAAKVVKDGNTDKVKYSIHDARTPGMIHFLKFLDSLRLKIRPWAESSYCGPESY